MKPQPWLAEKAENIEPTVWRITLKDNVTFSNGEKMTADKVIASLKRTAETNDRAAWLKDAEYTAEGNILTIRTKAPYATLVNDLCDPYAVIVDVAGTKDFENEPICTGPFVMSSFEADKHAVMTKNPKYWGGDVKVDEVEYTKIADFNTLAMALQGDEIDVALDLSPETAETIAANDKFTVVKTPQTRTYQLYMNLDKLTDPAVRQAIMYGVDKKTIGDQYLKGAMTASNSAFLASTPYGDPALKARSYDPEKAKQVLAAAGYTDTNGDGLVEKNGQPLTVEMGVYKRTRTAWVVVRSALAWARVPHADEELTITTRPEAHRRGMCKRITEFRDARGDEIGLMDARWVLVNTEDRSIYRHLPESYGWVAFNENIDRELRVRIPRKLEGTYVRSVHAGFSYCDANGHVNNTRYADLICDALDLPRVRRNAACDVHPLVVARIEDVGTIAFKSPVKC